MLDHAQRGRLGRRLMVTGAAAALVAASLTAGSSSASANVEPGNVDGQLWAELADGATSSFWVYLDERADLSQAPINTAEMPINRVDTTRWVHDTLAGVAERSQADLRETLTERGVEHTPFWISNAIYVTGDAALARELAERSDVSHLEADRQYELIEPTERVEMPINGVQQVEWGIANINADQVWSDFGVTGEGITVASIDTGVRHTHSAVVDQYRGNLGGGNFDHDYNWHDPTGQCPVGVPCDNNNHGTHVTGTMVGDDGGSNQIGVAPDANWIAAKGCASASCASNHLLSAGQWMLAPTTTAGTDPDPSRAPHIVNNSWGGGHGDTWYQDTIEAWVSAGIFPMFAAGNAGSACNTASSPGDNIPAYAIGAYDSGNNIASFSSRGFSGVDGSTIKPNASAPGVSVRSATAGSDTAYGSFSGTSMASPHAAGVVALVWSANPDYIGDIDATRDLLDGTARSTSNLQCGGTADNNNVFGQGRIDAHAAVTEASDGDVPPPAPTAEFTHTCDDTTLTCTFDGSGSASAEGTIVDWAWDLGDGNTANGEVVTHTYAAGGAYEVTLTVTDDNNGTGSDTQTVAIGPNQPPVADFSASCSGFIFIFWCDFDGGASSDPDGDIVSYQWQFGDGNTGTGQTVTHFYGSSGTYDVTLTVTDDSGLTDSITQPVNVPVFG